MDVSFTGFKNTSCSYIIERPIVKFVNSRPVLSKNRQMFVYTINTQLTDDFNGKDFQVYSDSLANSELAGRFHPVNKDMVNIQTIKTNPDNGDFHLVINDTEVEINDKNLGLISFVAKLLKRIAGEKPNNFVVNKDYLASEEPAFATNLGTDMRKVFTEHEQYEQFVNIAHEPKSVKHVSKHEFNDIQHCMEEYFS